METEAPVRPNAKEWERTPTIRCDEETEHGGHYHDQYGKTWFCPGRNGK